MTATTTTAKDIAKWMADELKAQTLLYQETVVYDIIEKFGEEFTKINSNGNPAINADVLKAFNALTGDAVVWVRSERYWRAREEWDEPGRMQP